MAWFQSRTPSFRSLMSPSSHDRPTRRASRSDGQRREVALDRGRGPRGSAIAASAGRRAAPSTRRPRRGRRRRPAPGPSPRRRTAGPSPRSLAAASTISTHRAGVLERRLRPAEDGVDPGAHPVGARLVGRVSDLRASARRDAWRRRIISSSWSIVRSSISIRSQQRLYRPAPRARWTSGESSGAGEGSARGSPFVAGCGAGSGRRRGRRGGGAPAGAGASGPRAARARRAGSRAGRRPRRPSSSARIAAATARGPGARRWPSPSRPGRAGSGGSR